MTVLKTFEFAGSENEVKRGPVKIEIKVKDADGKSKLEELELRNDLTGVELLEYIAAASPGPGSTRGIASFLRRIVPEDDWERFAKATEGAAPHQIGEMAGELIDAYSTFPTSEGDGSSSG